MSDLDRFKGERDDLRRQLRLSQENQGRLMMQNKDLELKHKDSVEKFVELERRWKRIQEDLIDQIGRQKEQIDGKRALWMDQNPGSSAKRDAMQALRDPFHSPLASQTPSYVGGAMSSMTTPTVITPSGFNFASTSMDPPKFGEGYVPPIASFTASQAFPPASGKNIGSSRRGESRSRKDTGPPPALEMRRGGMPTGVPVQSAYLKMPFPPEHTIYGSHQTFHTEPGTPPRPSRSNAMVVHKSDDEIAAEYKSLVTNLYDLIENWARKYACVPNQKNDRALASGNHMLWDYMMNCTYPGHRQDSHTHVVALLNNRNTRFWFVMRIATQYCVKDIMSIKAFRSYNKGVEKTIDMVLIKLSERGLNNEARQRYIDQASEAIQAVMGSKNFQSFRAQQLGVHTKALRDMLGPLLDDGVTRASAGVDLGAIAVLSWDLSCKMHTSRLTFQIYFPETNGKFTAATMEHKDMTNADPLQLQIEQVRLKLVITPVITMRDDRGTTIRAKNIHSAMVLLMK
ncbi:hypothetical protein D0Z07_4805 [Hyphodiscus hymeniophilus]|uniref:Uncharacterized protein n=1 Tax=Hyphodiscus hymeniophilus TaxID=353542 RepID=A0A9P6VJS8_9HELO|nr:hypothetical protein D0Z07_4805 [Hyphodiscus hymeniophilus]